MKRPMGFAAFIIILLLLVVSDMRAASSDGLFDIDVMVAALRDVENWDGKSRGKAGERGPWQITPAVWAQFSNYPFSFAEGHSPFECAEQRRVAREYVYWIQERIEISRMATTPFQVALVWTAGWNAVMYGTPHTPSSAKRAYAKRAKNIYYDRLKNRVD